MAVLIAALLLLASCHPKAVPVGAPVHRGPYAYVLLDDGTYLVTVYDDRYLREAQDEIGCGTAATCFVKYAGKIYIVEPWPANERKPMNFSKLLQTVAGNNEALQLIFTVILTDKRIVQLVLDIVDNAIDDPETKAAYVANGQLVATEFLRKYPVG